MEYEYDNIGVTREHLLVGHALCGQRISRAGVVCHQFSISCVFPRHDMKPLVVFQDPQPDVPEGLGLQVLRARVQRAGAGEAAREDQARGAREWLSSVTLFSVRLSSQL